MTPNEAIRRITEHNRIHSKKEPQAILITEAMDMAVKALERQIPKRVVLQPFEEEDISTTLSLCPVCGDIVKVEYNKCCANCGQKLNWRYEF